MALSPQYARAIVLFLSGTCALYSAGVFIFEPLLQVLVYSLAVFPLGLAWIWYALGEARESKGYGLTALVATAASMTLALSTAVGPLMPVTAGLVVLGFLKRDSLLFLAGVASLTAMIISDRGYVLVAAAQGSSTGLSGLTVYSVLTVALLAAAGGMLWTQRRQLDRRLVRSAPRTG